MAWKRSEVSYLSVGGNVEIQARLLAPGNDRR